MNKKKTTYLIAFLAILCVIVFFLFGNRKDKNAAIPADIGKVTAGDITETLSTSGTLIPKRTQSLYGSGQVTEVKVQVGDKVKKDQILAKYSSGLTLKAPIGGTISEVNITKDTPDTSAQAGKAAVVVDDLSTLKIALGLSKSEATEIKKNQTVKITSGDQHFSGKVTSINPVAQVTQSTTGTISQLPAEISFDKAPKGLFAGFDVDLDITTDKATGVLLMPIEALQHDKNNRAFVYTVKNQQAKKVLVTLGIQSNTEVQVTKGLSAGDKVILSPDSNIKNHSTVKEK